MRVRVLYFGVLKDVFDVLGGGESEMIELAEGASVGDLLALYRGRGRGSAAVLDGDFLALLDSVAVAVNQVYARAEVRLKQGDEVALLPPVSGGSDDGPVRMATGLRAGSDRDRAGSDKDRAGSDKDRAGSDRDRAGIDKDRDRHEG